LETYVNLLIQKNKFVTPVNKIMSYDFKRKRGLESKVLKIEEVCHVKLIELCFADDTITCRKDHPF
jgi:hypothetical protein